jgi:septum formation protein
MTGAAGSVRQAAAPPLVLASTSPYRQALLDRLGLSYRCRAPKCDEDALKARGQNPPGDPRVLAERLAHAKAASVLADEPDAAIIGCDQLAAIDGRIFGKPMTAAAAIEQLAALSGRTHELITALAVLRGDRVLRHIDVTTLSMRPLSRPAIERYVEADHPWDCAGSYKVEACGIVLFDRIDTADHTAITGLPLIALCSILRELGYEIP